MDITLAQRGRALMDFEVAVRQAAGRLQLAVERELAEAGITAETLPDAMAERHRVIDAAIGDSDTYRLRALFGEWCATNHGRAATEAYHEVREQLAPALAALDAGPTTIDYRDGFTAPGYWSNIWFHRTHGGWDGHDANGFIHGEIVHKKYVARIFPGDLYAMRRRVAAEPPAESYGRILELGTSSGHYTVALAEAFPDAELWGIDPSPRMLEQARRTGNESRRAWRLFVGVGEDSGFAGASFDLVTAYAIHHELPPRIVRSLFDEIFRVLRPGGDFLIADVKRTRDHDRLTAWRFDWLAKWGGEPYWRATAAMDFAALARDAGFVDVEAYGMAPTGDPHVVRGRKPA